ncbi:MAG: hypothetical protein Q9M14_07295 [Mariprofundaceae bacterium]|nr:hypothetical protein [Mariprofundaceae bacterium]
MMHNSLGFFTVLFGALLLFSCSSQATESNIDSVKQTITLSDTTQHFSDVMDQFNEEKALAVERAISDTSKHQVLFWMGAALLLLILLAAGFGIAMGIFDKDVFVWHVLSAGLATTLAVAHAVTAFVWFFPAELF